MTLRKRVERLESLRKKRANAGLRGAIIVMCGEDCDERHLEMTSPPASLECTFVEKPGPGPQLQDFGEFGPVVWFTPAEWEA